MTNVPGPREPRLPRGSADERACSSGRPCSGSVSMSVAIFSYAGALTVGLMADAGLVPDPERIVEAFEREVEALLRLKA